MTRYIFPGLKPPTSPLFFDLQTFIAENGGRLRLAEILECEVVREPKRGKRAIIKYTRPDIYRKSETDFIIENYGKMDSGLIATLLNRPINGIYDKIYRLKKQGLLVSL